MEREEHLFVVRMWREPGQTAGDPWRGSVVHVPTKRRLHFTSLADLNDFMRWRMGDASPPLHEETGREGYHP